MLRRSRRGARAGYVARAALSQGRAQTQQHFRIVSSGAAIAPWRLLNYAALVQEGLYTEMSWPGPREAARQNFFTHSSGQSEVRNLAIRRLVGDLFWTYSTDTGSKFAAC